MPNLIGGILLGFTWQFIFVQVFEAIGEKLQIGWLQGWLTNQKTGFIGLLIVVTWQLSGYMMMIYIAQIQNIPDSVLEAAQIDGAIGWNKLKSIILPLMMPAFTIGLFLSISNAFKLFDQNISLTGGGPVNSTQMLALNIYNTAFGENRFGLAQSKAVIFYDCGNGNFHYSAYNYKEKGGRGIMQKKRSINKMFLTIIGILLCYYFCGTNIDSCKQFF